MRRLRFALPLLLVAVLYGTNLGGWPSFAGDDEGTYYAQAWAVLTEGRLGHYAYWFDHPPLGWIQLAAVLRPAEGLAGDQPSLVAGRIAMALVMVISTALLYRVARDHSLPRPVAALAAAIWCLSPLTLFYGRQVLLDNIALMWLLAALALRRRALLSGLCFGVAVLSKETAVLATPGVLVALHLAGGGFRRWLGGAALMAGGWLAWVVVSGDLLPLLGAIEWQLHGRGASSDTAGILASWWSHDPVLLALGLVVVPLGLYWRETRGVALIPAVHLVAGLRPGGYLPAMHVITVLPFLALLTAYAARQVWPARRAFVTAAAVLLLAPLSILGVRTALTADENTGYRQALAYAAANLPRDSVVLTDDVTWNDLVRLGWNGDGFHGPVWHFKLDRDPRARTELPGGWRDVDYVLAGPAMTAMLGTPAISVEQSPGVFTAWRNSTVVGSWGPVQLRRVNPLQEGTA